MWMQRMNQRLMGLSPWAYAAAMASVMAVGTGLGMIIGRAATGDMTLDAMLLAGVGGGWLAAFLVTRLIAPAALQGMRQHQQWREERRQRDTHGAAGS